MSRLKPAPTTSTERFRNENLRVVALFTRTDANTLMHRAMIEDPTV